MVAAVSAVSGAASRSSSTASSTHQQQQQPSSSSSPSRLSSTSAAPGTRIQSTASSPRQLRRRSSVMPSSSSATTSKTSSTASAASTLKMKLPELATATSERNPPVLQLVQPPEKKNLPDVPQLPNELLLLINERTPTAELLNVRLASRKLSALVDVILETRLTALTTSLSARQDIVEDELKMSEREKRPLLRHYRNFLRDTTTQEITEATWYASPPEELKTVCACLCILKGASPSSSSTTTTTASTRRKLSTASIDSDGTSDSWLELPIGDISWPNIKKFMTKYDFKTWFCNLRAGVDSLSVANVKRVERIIMEDPNVTYERLREVSMAGYKLLIVVAACLQYGSISEELREKRTEIQTIEDRVSRYDNFLRSVRGCC